MPINLPEITIPNTTIITADNDNCNQTWPVIPDTGIFKSTIRTPEDLVIKYCKDKYRYLNDMEALDPLVPCADLCGPGEYFDCTTKACVPFEFSLSGITNIIKLRVSVNFKVYGMTTEFEVTSQNTFGMTTSYPIEWIVYRISYLSATGWKLEEKSITSYAYREEYDGNVGVTYYYIDLYWSDLFEEISSKLSLVPNSMDYVRTQLDVSNNITLTSSLVLINRSNYLYNNKYYVYSASSSSRTLSFSNLNTSAKNYLASLSANKLNSYFNLGL